MGVAVNNAQLPHPLCLCKYRLQFQPESAKFVKKSFTFDGGILGKSII